MAYGKITKKQEEILEYIKNEILNRGFPPAVREICEAVHLKSTSSVHAHLETLEKAGYILSSSSRFDLIISYCLKNSIYNIYKINEILYEEGEKTLGC